MTAAETPTPLPDNISQAISDTAILLPLHPPVPCAVYAVSDNSHIAPPGFCSLNSEGISSLFLKYLLPVSQIAVLNQQPPFSRKKNATIRCVPPMDTLP